MNLKVFVIHSSLACMNLECVLGGQHCWHEDSSCFIVTAVHQFTGNKVWPFCIADVQEAGNIFQASR